uniref:NR LBD domain-containing protein n=1 Tax=Mola mola TaxID=94237 RepID=A0A3Q3WJU7_MOLML
MSICERREQQGSILYSILKRCAPCRRGKQLCSCASPSKLMALRAPRPVFQAASRVLAKTLRFVKSVPCFRGLSAEDQLRLVRHSWAPLLVLGMVQDSVDFDMVEVRQPSLLHTILTHNEIREVQDPGVPVSAAEGIKMFLVRCRGLRISVKEYAFLRGTILFSPGKRQLVRSCLE